MSVLVPMVQQVLNYNRINLNVCERRPDYAFCIGVLATLCPGHEIFQADYVPKRSEYMCTDE